jgi:hypothetical protein
MPFDPARWPNAARVRDLIAERIPLGIHCGKCSPLCDSGPGRAAAGARELCASARRPLPVYPLRLTADGSQAGVLQAGRAHHGYGG